MFNRQQPPYRTNLSIKFTLTQPPTLEQGLSLHRQGDFEGAARAYQALLRTEPENANAWHLLGVATEALGNRLHGIELMEKALAIKPDMAAAHLNRANALKRLDRLEEALLGYGAALALKTDYALAHANRGTVLEALGRFSEALSAYDQALAIDPQHAEACWNKAALCLLLGNFEEGWPLFEARWRVAAHGLQLRRFSQPLWLGDSPIEGRTLLIHTEQGLGDNLQFCRLARIAVEWGAKVVVEAPGALVELLGSLHPDIRIVEQGQPLPLFDLHCPIGSLPLALKLRLDTIPAFASYLHAPPSRLSLWKERLPPRTRPRVGLVWSGNAAHFNDNHRSIPLALLVQALPPKFDYFSLQRELRPADEATLREIASIHHFGDRLENFADTAALCELMDFIVSVDTSVAHLAGAIGRPTWLLLPHLPDWRWLLRRTDSPWYPSVKLMRQSQPNQWQPVLEHLAQELQALSEPRPYASGPDLQPTLDVEHLEQLFHSGRFNELEMQATQLLEHFPETGFLWSVLAAALKAQSKPAISAFKRAAELLPLDSDAQSAYAEALYLSGEAGEAVSVYVHASTVAPLAAAQLNNMGNAYKSLGDETNASACYRQAITLDSRFAPAHYNLGLCERDAGNPLKAIEELQLAIDIDPGFIAAYVELGTLLKEQGSSEQGLESLRIATRIDPSHYIAHLNLGAMLLALGRYDDARHTLVRGLELAPQAPDAWVYMGISLLGLRRCEEAKAALQKALVLQPTHALALVTVAGMLVDQGELTDALTLLNQALRSDPYNTQARSTILFLKSHVSGIDPRALFQEHCAAGQALHAHISRLPTPIPPTFRNPVVRVGFISGDFSNHIVARCLLPVLRHLSKSSRLHIVGYYMQPEVDDWTKRLQACTKEWCLVAGMAPLAVAQRIRGDGIDVLIDLAGHTSHGALEVLACQPARVQVSWLGYTWTTGLRNVDYYLTDSHWLPPGRFDSLFTEKLRYLPAWLPFAYEDDAPEVTPLPAWRQPIFTFCSFNHTRKVSLEVVALWSQILRACPHARLVVAGIDSTTTESRLLNQFALQGIDGNRLVFHQRVPASEYLELHGTVDLCLDAFPFCSATTVQHAAWMGVPTVTLCGSTPISCASAGVLRHLGLDAFIAHDPQHYVRIAIEWAGNLDRLAAIRARLREILVESAMARCETIAQGLEELLLEFSSGIST